jgi:hypothetical protein
VTRETGRVVLFDVATWTVARIWKGYRDAQCAWITSTEDVSDDTADAAGAVTEPGSDGSRGGGGGDAVGGSSGGSDSDGANHIRVPTRASSAGSKLPPRQTKFLVILVSANVSLSLRYHG